MAIGLNTLKAYARHSYEIHKVHFDFWTTIPGQHLELLQVWLNHHIHRKPQIWYVLVVYIYTNWPTTIILEMERPSYNCSEPEEYNTHTDELYGWKQCVYLCMYILCRGAVLVEVLSRPSGPCQKYYSKHIYHNCDSYSVCCNCIVVQRGLWSMYSGMDRCCLAT